MNIVRVPRAGEKRLPLPNANRRVLRDDRSQSRSNSGTAIRGGLRAAGPQDWFWKLHSTDESAQSPVRWAQALESLKRHRRTSKPIASRALLSQIVTRYGPTIAAAAERHTISAALIAAVIAVESAGRERAVSHAGAQGLMQLMPATAQRFGVDDSYSARENIFGGAAYLSWLLNNFGQDPILALAGYNAGEGSVQRYDGVPPFRETRDYVVKVFDALVSAETLCLRAPDTPRSPCDWQYAVR
ncbi:MAG: lytic transglycosylase domain-containing protein [Pseudomonadota bacterium]